MLMGFLSGGERCKDMGRRVFGVESGRKRRFSGVVRAKDAAILRWRFAAAAAAALVE